MVPEQHPAIGRVEILAVAVGLRGRRALVAGFDDFVLDQPGVEAERDDVRAHGGEHEPDGVDLLAADDGDHRPGKPAEQRNDQIGDAGRRGHRDALPHRDRWLLGICPDEFGVGCHRSLSTRDGGGVPLIRHSTGTNFSGYLDVRKDSAVRRHSNGGTGPRDCWSSTTEATLTTGRCQAPRGDRASRSCRHPSSQILNDSATAVSPG